MPNNKDIDIATSTLKQEQANANFQLPAKIKCNKADKVTKEFTTVNKIITKPVSSRNSPNWNWDKKRSEKKLKLITCSKIHHQIGKALLSIQKRF